MWNASTGWVVSKNGKVGKASLTEPQPDFTVLHFISIALKFHTWVSCKYKNHNICLPWCLSRDSQLILFRNLKMSGSLHRIPDKLLNFHGSCTRIFPITRRPSECKELYTKLMSVKLEKSVDALHIKNTAFTTACDLSPSWWSRAALRYYFYKSTCLSQLCSEIRCIIIGNSDTFYCCLFSVDASYHFDIANNLIYALWWRCLLRFS